MRSILSVKKGIFLIGVFLIIGVGIVYAVEIQRDISGSVIIGKVQTVDKDHTAIQQNHPGDCGPVGA